MYAIVDIQGKQVCVTPGAIVEVPKIANATQNQNFVFDKVLFFSKDAQTHETGTPFIKGIQIKAIIESPLLKRKKIQVFKYKKNKMYRKFQGHREQYSKLKIETIEIQNK